jgi:hypothetical protein
MEIDGLVGAVVDRDAVAARGGAGHGQQAHGGHRAHLEDGAADALVCLAGQAVAGQLVHEADRAVDRLDPRLAPAEVVVEARVLVEELELLQGGGEVLVAVGEGLAHVVGDGALAALGGVGGAVEDVALGGLELAGGLQHHLDDVLHLFHARRAAARLGRHDVHRALRQLVYRRLGGAVERGEAARDGALDPLDVEGHHAPVALHDRRRHLHARLPDAIKVRRVMPPVCPFRLCCHSAAPCSAINRQNESRAAPAVCMVRPDFGEMARYYVK